MKIISLVFILVFLTACSQNVGLGLGIGGIGISGDNVAATEVTADSQTGVHGSVAVGTTIGL